MSVPEVAHSLSMNQRIMVIESKDESKSSVKSIPWHNVDEVPPRPKTESVQAPDKGTLQQCSIAQGTHLEVGSLSSVQLETLGVNMNSIARTGLEDSHQLKPLTRTLKPTAYCSPGSKSTIIHSDADTALQRRNLYKSLASFGGRSLPALGHAPSGCSVTNKTVKPPGQRSSSVEPSNQVTVPSELIGQRSLSVDADMMHSTQVDQQPIVISTRRPHIRPEVHLPLDIDRSAPELTDKLSAPTLEDINYILGRWSERWSKERREVRNRLEMKDSRIQPAKLELFGLPVLQGRKLFAQPAGC